MRATLALQSKNSKVQEVVVDTFIESINTNVYEAYTSPAIQNPYERQRENGGLTDRDNFEVENTPNGIAISSIRKGVNNLGAQVNVLEVLEGYEDWAVKDVWGYGFQERRNVVEPVRDELRHTTKLKLALAEDLIKHGFKVK